MTKGILIALWVVALLAIVGTYIAYVAEKRDKERAQESFVKMVEFSNRISKAELLMLDKVYPIARGRMVDSSKKQFLDHAMAVFRKLTSEIDSVTVTN